VAELAGVAQIALWRSFAPNGEFQAAHHVLSSLCLAVPASQPGEEGDIGNGQKGQHVGVNQVHDPI
jgi:hypothetical protein